ncbi:hypothetical protein P9112_012915 [Eukaryota sp. TZLM1-RC]
MPKSLKTVLLGSKNAGKSSFLHKTCYNQSVASAGTGIPQPYCELNVENAYRIQMWDIPLISTSEDPTSEFDLRNFPENLLKNMDVAIILFNSAANDWQRHILKWKVLAEKASTILVVGTHLDILMETTDETQMERTFGKFCRQNSLFYVGCCCLEGENSGNGLNTVMNVILEIIKEKYPSGKPVSSEICVCM